MSKHSKGLHFLSHTAIAWTLAGVCWTGLAAGEGQTMEERFSSLDTNSDRVIDREEAEGDEQLSRNFDSTDVDRDATISPAEFMNYAVETGAAPAAEPTESWFTAPHHKPD